METLDAQWIVMFGNPADGFRFVGPFDDNEEAFRFGETIESYEWWIILLEGKDGTGKTEDSTNVLRKLFTTGNPDLARDIRRGK